MNGAAVIVHTTLIKGQLRYDAFESPQAIPMMIRTADHPTAISLSNKSLS